MSPDPDKAQKIATVIVQRRLDDALSGSAVYLLNCLKALEQAGFVVRIVATPRSSFGSRPISRPDRIFRTNSRSITWPRTWRIGTLYIAQDLSVWIRAANRIARQIVWLLRGKREAERPSIPSTLGWPPEAGEAAETACAVNAIPSTLVVGEYSSLGPLVKDCNADARAVLLHDLFSLRSKAFTDAGLPPDHAALSFADETARLADVDFCIHASSTEAAALKEKLPDCRHIWLPPEISATTPEITAPAKTRIVFIGVKHGGNYDALDAILNDIWPKVHEARPEAELWIVGEIAETVPTPPAGVILRTRLENLSELAGPDTIGFAPTRVMSGISIKLATYLELGCCVVCHSKTLDAYGGHLDDIVCHAETDGDFVAILIDLLDDPQLRRKKAGHAAQIARERLSNRDLVTYLETIDAGPVSSQTARKL